MQPLMFVNDVHFASTPPGLRNELYAQCLEEKFAEIAAIQKEIGAVCVQNGDVFHSKNPRNVSHTTVRTAIRLLMPLNPYVVLGNHDVIGGELTSVERQPMGVVIESGAVRRLSRVVLEDIELVGLDYNEDFEQSKITIDLGPRTTGLRVVVAHSLLVGSLRERLLGEFDWCFYGHEHHDMGVDGRFVNFGALVRIRNEPWEWERKVAVAVLDKGKVYRRDLKCMRPWEDVRSKLVHQKEVDPFEEFVKAVELMEVEEHKSVEEILAALDPELRAKVKEYIGEI